MNNTEKEIISLLTEDSRITAKQIAAALGITEKAAAQTVRSLEERGVIVKYTAIVNADSVDEDFVEALIEVKVTPQRGHGFDMIAEEFLPIKRCKAFTL